MGFVVILRSLGLGLSCVCVAMLAPLFFALITGDAQVAGAYGIAFVIAALVAAGLIASSLGQRKPTDLRAAILVVLLWWTTAPLLGALPFVFDGMPVLDAYFEAASSLTTTGAWLSETNARENETHLLWRAIMQWLGGLASLAIAAAIFIRPAFIGIDTLLPPFSRGDKGSDFRAIYNAVRTFAGVYATLCGLCLGLLVAVGVPVFDAAIMALSSVASGGLLPDARGPAAYGATVSAILMIFFFLSGANFVLISRAALGRQKGVRDLETGAYAIMVLCVGALFWLVLGAGDVDLIPVQVFNASSMMSTNGLTLGDKPPLAVALVAVLIGGSAISTAGGFKVLRWLVIFRRSREEIRRLIEPAGVFGKSDIANELGVWMHFLALTMTVAALTLIITSGGHSFELSAAAAVGLLSNAGPVIHLAGDGADGYGVIDYPGLKIAMIAGMVLGRLEAVTALALFNLAFWKS